MHAVDPTCVPMASKEDLQLNRATSVVEVLGTLSPSEMPDSLTDFSAQGQRRTIPKVQVSLSSAKRLAVRVKEQSECIQTEPQNIYKLKLRKVVEDKEKGVAKYRFGKPRIDTQEYVVMLVGATGAGKSTLINGMINYILGVDWKDDFRFKLIADEGGTSQAHSQTTTITAYTISHQQGSPFEHTLTIVDAPSFEDTKGLDSGKRIVEQIRAFLSMPGKKGIDHIHGIGFVTQASLARLTPTQKYVFDSILAVFGKDIGKNILMMTTFADGKTPPVLEAVDEAGIGYCKSFKFNNSALYTDQAGGGQEAEVVSSFDKMFWDMGMASFKAFFKQLACMEARSLQLTKEVLEERKQLEVIMQSLPCQIKAILGKIGTLQQEEHIMEQHKADIAASKNFKYEVMEPRIVKRNTVPGQYVTNCTKCNFTCHQDCAYANNDDKRYCCAMSGEHCDVCKLQCHWSFHVNNPFWFEAQEVTVEKTYDELKKRYEAALSGKSSKENIVSMIRAEVATSYQEVFLMIRQAQQILRQLDEIVLHPNPLSAAEYIDLLIHTEEMDGGPGTVQRVKCLQNVRKQAEVMSTMKDDKIFELEALKQAQQLAKAEAEKVGWLKKAATSTWSPLTEFAEHFK